MQFPDANPVQYTYDAGGNLLSDGRWTYTWTTECRLAAIESTAAVPAAARQRLAFTYDGEGRRRSKMTLGFVVPPSGFGVPPSAPAGRNIRPIMSV